MLYCHSKKTSATTSAQVTTTLPPVHWGLSPDLGVLSAYVKQNRQIKVPSVQKIML